VKALNPASPVLTAGISVRPRRLPCLRQPGGKRFLIDKTAAGFKKIVFIPKKDQKFFAR